MTHTAPDLPQAFEKLSGGDVVGAIGAVVAASDAGAALDNLDQLCKHAYRELKNLRAMTAIALEAIRFGLRCADVAGDAESARGYKSRVRAIAYNAGANCWPGWGDPVEITGADVARGFKLAERNAQLVKELELGGKELGGSFWLLGALQMAAARASPAIAHFLAAQKAFHDAGLPIYEEMARGYAALAVKTQPGTHSGDARSLTTILESLRAMESREAQFFAEQLVTADRIFSSR
jgi:hypothetical protein